MKWRGLQRIIPVLVVLTAAPPIDRPPDEPVALLLEVGDSATVSRGTRETDFPAKEGDLVLAGGRLLTGGRPATFLYYPNGKFYRFEPVRRASYPAPAPIENRNRQFEVAFVASARAPEHNGNLSEIPKQWKAPLLPPARSRNFLSQTETKALDQQLALVQKTLDTVKDKHDLLALRLTKSVLLERMNRASQALAEYQTLAQAWTSTRWLQTKVRNLNTEIKVAQEKAMLASRAPRTYAVVIGVPNTRELAQVKSAGADANAFARYLQEKYATALEVFRFVDKEATWAAIRETIRSVLEDKAGPRDTVYIFISGHGLVELVEGSRKGFLLTSDGDPAEKGVSAYGVEELARLIRANLPRLGKLYFFADVCRIASYRGNTNEINVAIRENLGNIEGRMLGILSGTGVEPSQRDSGMAGGVGVFTHHLLEGLRGRASSDGEIFQYVSAKVREATGQRQNPSRFGQAADPAVARDRLVMLAFSGRLMPGLLAFASQAGQAAGLPQETVQAVALEDQGQQVIVRYLRGEQEPQKQADFAEAADLFRRAEAANPAPELTARRLFCEGHALTLEEDRADFGPPVRLLEQALGLDPDAAYIYNALGIAHLRQGEFHKAAWAFRDAIRLAPSWIYPRHNLGLTYEERGAYEAAQEVFRGAIALAPDYSYLHYSLGRLLHGLGERGPAENEYRKALALDSQLAEAHVALGVLRAADDKPQQAQREYEQAIRLAPDLMPAWHNLGLLHLRQGRVKDAIKTWQDGLKRKPNYIPSRLSLAAAYRAEGDFESAIAQYEQVLNMRRQYAGAEMALHETRGDQLTATREAQRAAEEYRKALALAADEIDQRRLRKKLQK